jgi:hypothetical protein
MGPNALVQFSQLVAHPGGAQVGAAAADLRPLIAGLILLAATVACAKVLSTAAKALGTLMEVLKALVRALLLATAAAVVVIAVLILAIVEMLAVG